MTLNPIRITQKQATELLSISINALRKLVQTDPTFPKPYKTGTSRQCAVYYDYQAIKQWHEQQLENANANNGEV